MKAITTEFIMENGKYYFNYTEPPVKKMRLTYSPNLKIIVDPPAEMTNVISSIGQSDVNMQNAQFLCIPKI